jgi:hypothetical protein
MGYSISWVATNGLAPDDVLAQLELSRTGQFAEYAESPLSGAVLPSGWFLLVARGCNHGILGAEVLAGLAQDGCRVVACSIEEHVMYCSAEEWREGIRIWRTEHDAQKGMLHLHSEGRLPESFAEVQHRCAEEQRAEGGEAAEVDCYFEIPLQTARDIVGFKHDEETADLEPESFEAFAGPLAKSGKAWWQFWR